MAWNKVQFCQNKDISLLSEELVSVNKSFIIVLGYYHTECQRPMLVSCDAWEEWGGRVIFKRHHWPALAADDRCGYSFRQHEYTDHFILNVVKYEMKQECISVGCVPYAAVAVSGRGCLPRGLSACQGSYCCERKLNDSLYVHSPVAPNASRHFTGPPAFSTWVTKQHRTNSLQEIRGEDY